MAIDFKKYLLSLDGDVCRAVGEYDAIFVARDFDSREKAIERYKNTLEDIGETVIGLKTGVHFIK